ncbi:MAG: hypothetical protein HRU43_00915 [Simkaniaceae bacterium]|nr:hypothetical protein [Simkaniaceae bacterium]
MLQFAIPTIVGLQDVAPSFQNNRYNEVRINVFKICTLIAIQRYGCMLIKKIAQKKRPDGSDFQSFPSGHFMIGTQCLTRSLYRDGFPSTTAVLVLIGTVSIGLGRYLPKKHDLVELNLVFIGFFLLVAKDLKIFKLLTQSEIILSLRISLGQKKEEMTKPS